MLRIYLGQPTGYSIERATTCTIIPEMQSQQSIKEQLQSVVKLAIRKENKFSKSVLSQQTLSNFKWKNWTSIYMNKWNTEFYFILSFQALPNLEILDDSPMPEVLKWNLKRHAIHRTIPRGRGGGCFKKKMQSLTDSRKQHFKEQTKKSTNYFVWEDNQAF